MKIEKLNLQMFTGHTVTVYNDGHTSAASASPNSSVDKDTEVTLTLTPSSGYEIDNVEVISGGVTVNMTTKKFAMGEADVVLMVHTKKNNVYMVTENRDVIINNSKTSLTRNMTLEYAANGAVKGVSCSGTEVTLDAGIVAQLVAEGVLIKM